MVLTKRTKSAGDAVSFLYTCVCKLKASRRSVLMYWTSVVFGKRKVEKEQAKTHRLHAHGHLAYTGVARQALVRR